MAKTCLRSFGVRFGENILFWHHADRNGPLSGFTLGARNTKFGTGECCMIRTRDIRKLSDFRQNATSHLDRLAETGDIEVLTVNGEAKGVLMAPHVFDALAERMEYLETTASVHRGLADAASGRTRPARGAIHKLAVELGLDLTSASEE